MDSNTARDGGVSTLPVRSPSAASSTHSRPFITPPQTPLGPSSTDSPTPLEEPGDTEPDLYAHHHYVLKRLRRACPAPSPRRLRIITGALCASMILCGWNDGSVGPLIPSLQRYYDINYLKMSILFIMVFVGSLIAGLTNVWITDRIGFGLVTPLAAVSTGVAYLIAGTGAPYPVFLIGYIFNGFGMGIQDAQVNNLVTRLPNADTKMSIVQACFSLGGTVSPFISTAFAQHVEAAYRYFFVAMGVAIVAAGIMLWAFEGKTEEQLTALLPKDADVRREKKERKEREKENGEAKGHQERVPSIVLNEAAPLPPADAEIFYVPDSSGTKMLRIFSTPSVYALIIWAFLYVGVEVSISGWLTSFLINERGASAAAGYAVTGFWGGMSVGRIVLIPVTKKIGYQFSIYLYAAIALALELTIWFTHSLIGNGVCYAFVGFFLGPIYPNALMVVSQVLDDDLRGGVMGIMGSLGGAGAAAIPFMTGGIADKHGIWTIQPIAVAMIAAFTTIWMFVPRKRITSRYTPKRRVIEK
ncbi:uncharacterized protein CcaverHIS019_0309990 [Cutaneotrichosporon cavernicola]|uniref:Major facilitator superfamily (MFS) profile domain-containing protein n=1 Tax=Cutaneotrichosporon cavernicola TaxID=279322 RepID=A0AA48I735_9TREE|nr:uncharacterized protein CcaverHIS019_0309990 [Cutaneotrichosporon cavernicola]BEI90929.1 hypothetical protein CcaverHIS019_0309990 [Cutaneotrichosporon cavernicola]BEI98708.1 hypothetical protein CcaverHIS631_0310070 [Cutaneotrichosporon cavernicola]BEJ06478.1 hypothetical protein CcaverHIS641_0310000 [Cutaneotrichosporon cavernicola]